jgi:hypothetical protein
VGGEDAGVVDQDGGRAEGGFHGFGYGVDGGWVGDVAPEVFNMGIWRPLLDSASLCWRLWGTYSPVSSQAVLGYPARQL